MASKQASIKKGTQPKLRWYDDTVATELMAFCPNCKAMETLSFGSRGLMATRRFSQRSGKVYHDCGAGVPCRLYSLS